MHLHLQGFQTTSLCVALVPSSSLLPLKSSQTIFLPFHGPPSPCGHTSGHTFFNQAPTLVMNSTSSLSQDYSAKLIDGHCALKCVQTGVQSSKARTVLLDYPTILFLRSLAPIKSPPSSLAREVAETSARAMRNQEPLDTDDRQRGYATPKQRL